MLRTRQNWRASRSQPLRGFGDPGSVAVFSSKGSENLKVTRCAEATPDVLVVQNHDLEGEVLLQILEDHHEEGELDAQRLVRVGGARDVPRGGGASKIQHCQSETWRSASIRSSVGL